MKMLKNQLMADRSYHILADRPEDRSLPSAILRQPLRIAWAGRMWLGFLRGGFLTDISWHGHLGGSPGDRLWLRRLQIGGSTEPTLAVIGAGEGW